MAPVEAVPDTVVGLDGGVRGAWRMPTRYPEACRPGRCRSTCDARSPKTETTVNLLGFWVLWMGSNLSVARGVDDGFTFVFLHGGPNESALEAEKHAEVMSGHFANMDRLVAEGALVAAGPLGRPRGVESHRGIFLLTTADADRAATWTQTDPAVAAGVLRAELVPLSTDARLDRILELEDAATQRRRANGTDEAWQARPMVWATCDDAVAAEELLDVDTLGHRILFRGCFEGERGGEGLWLIDADTAEAAQAYLSELETAGRHALEWTLHPWYGSTELAHLPRLAQHSDAPSFRIDAIDENDRLSVFREWFSKTTSVFGIPIVVTGGTTDAKLLHAAHVLAQYIDNDEDGVPDHAEVLRELVSRGAFLAMAATDRKFEQLDIDFEAFERAGFTIGQDLYGEETMPHGPPHSGRRGRFDAALEEVLHLYSNGFDLVHPDVFGFHAGSKIADAMDLARGGRFQRNPRRYPDDAWYSYYDRTCDYSCQVTEYFYWALTSLLGGQDYPGRAEEIAVEWRAPTWESMLQRDPAASAILTDAEHRLPKRLPNGRYFGLDDE